MEEPPSVFKKSTDLGYCIRNRFLARSPDYKITYFIPHDSVHPENGQVSFAIQSILELNPFLKATIGLYSNYALHITIDEQNPIHPRYKIPREDILNSDILPLQVIPRVTESSITWEIAGYKYILHLSPILIQGYYKGDLIISVNQNSLLNFERYRNESDIIGHSGYDLIDTTGLPGNTNQWEEEFNGNVEVIPKGPSSIGVDVVFHNTSAVYGIPEHSNEVSLKDTMDSEPYRLYNSDVFLYKLDRTDGLYGSIPFMVSKHAGVFWVNSSDTSIDIRTSGNDKITHWYSETGVLELMLFLSSSPIDLISTFTVMTGPAALPPLFSLGYHQCRWNYYSQKEVLEINSKFDYYDIPLDVIWLDIEHTDKKKYFTWDSEAFPEPIKMQDILALNGRKLVNIIDPHILIDPNYEVYNFFNSNRYFVKDINHQEYQAKCWPGICSWPDFMDPKVREAWSWLFDYKNYRDSSFNLFVWNDMNEPAVFESPENTMPKTNLHLEDVEHRDVHNLYGLQMQRSTYKGLENRSQGTIRPFLLTRSFFVSSHRYGAAWTGDNGSSWEYLKFSVPMCLTLASAGLSFCGADVGGFFGEPSSELMYRWFQLGSFLPFFRSHAHIETKNREPWAYDTETTEIIRYTIKNRYKLLPYWYSLFFLYYLKGLPVIRTMFFQYPDDNCLQFTSQFHLGDALCVNAVDKPSQQTMEIVLPDGRWFDYYSLKEITSGIVEYQVDKYSIPVFIRGGNTIPIQPPAKSSFFMDESPYSFVVALNPNLESVGYLYKDDGCTFDYRQGRYLYASIAYKSNQIIYKVSNYMDYTNIIHKIIVLGLTSKPDRITLCYNHIENNLEYGFVDNILKIHVAVVAINREWEINIIYD